MGDTSTDSSDDQTKKQERTKSKGKAASRDVKVKKDGAGKLKKRSKSREELLPGEDEEARLRRKLLEKRMKKKDSKSSGDKGVRHKTAGAETSAAKSRHVVITKGEDDHPSAAKYSSSRSPPTVEFEEIDDDGYAIRPPQQAAAVKPSRSRHHRKHKRESSARGDSPDRANSYERKRPRGEKPAAGPSDDDRQRRIDEGWSRWKRSLDPTAISTSTSSRQHSARDRGRGGVERPRQVERQSSDIRQPPREHRSPPKHDSRDRGSRSDHHHHRSASSVELDTIEHRRSDRKQRTDPATPFEPPPPPPSGRRTATVGSTADAKKQQPTTTELPRHSASAVQLGGRAERTRGQQSAHPISDDDVSSEEGELSDQGTPLLDEVHGEEADEPKQAEEQTGDDSTDEEQGKEVTSDADGAEKSAEGEEETKKKYKYSKFESSSSSDSSSDSEDEGETKKSADSAASGDETDSGPPSVSGSVTPTGQEAKQSTENGTTSVVGDVVVVTSDGGVAADATEPPSPDAITDDVILVDPVSLLPVYYPGIAGCRSVEEFHHMNRIEEGTYGVVYRAKEKRTDEIVALKRLKLEKEKEGFPITSLREINMLLKSRHENVVNVREIVVGSNMDKIYMVMDFIEHDLKALMERMTQPFLIVKPGSHQEARSNAFNRQKQSLLLASAC